MTRRCVSTRLFSAKRYPTADLAEHTAIARKLSRKYTLSNSAKTGGGYWTVFSMLAQTPHHHEYSRVQSSMEVIVARFAPLCFALLAACIPTLAWSDAPPPNTVGHAHTCERYFPKEASETGAEGNNNDGLSHQERRRCARHSSGEFEREYRSRPGRNTMRPALALSPGGKRRHTNRIRVESQCRVGSVERPMDGPDGSGKSCIEQYPKEAASPGVHGATKLTIHVAADGSVRDATVLDTSGSKDTTISPPFASRDGG